MFNEIGPKLLSLIDSGKHISECGHFADTVRTYILREMVCGHNADIVRTYISRDICPHNVHTISFFGFQLRNEDFSTGVKAATGVK